MRISLIVGIVFVSCVVSWAISSVFSTSVFLAFAVAVFAVPIVVLEFFSQVRRRRQPAQR